MTSRGSAACNGHHRRPAAVDLSSVFGTAAAALSRRRIRTRRPRQAPGLEGRTSDADEAATGKSDSVEPEIMEDEVHDTKSSRARASARSVRSAAPGPVSRRSDAPAPRRRFSGVKVRDRQHVDLLLLAAATKGPANGHEFISLVHERSDGIFVLSLRTVIHELHRLANNRLMQVTGNGRVRCYSLTPLGERVLATRRREWEAFSHGFNRVFDGADDVDGCRDPGRGSARAE
jgi:DNA-binding PadR family transcriptional regulator